MQEADGVEEKQAQAGRTGHQEGRRKLSGTEG